MKIYMPSTGAFISVQNIHYMALNYEMVEPGQEVTNQEEIACDPSWTPFKKAVHQARVKLFGPTYKVTKGTTKARMAWKLRIEYTNEQRGDQTFWAWNDDKAVMVRAMEEIIAQTPTQWYTTGKVPVKVGSDPITPPISTPGGPA